MAKTPQKSFDPISDADRKVMRGGPQGDPDAVFEDEDEDEQDDPDEGQEPPKEKSLEEQMADMRAENARLTGLVEGISKAKPAPQPAPKKAEKPKRDWEKMLFEDTEKGVEALRQDIKEEILDEVRAGYVSDQGNKDFWRDFYDANKDIKKADDHDLVNALLHKHMDVLGDLQVDEAIKRLGDLTRERIMKYTGKTKKPADPKSKARVEGASEPSKKPQKTEEDNVVSLSDIIRGRKTARAKAMAGKAQTA
jgi:hypothetical protein